MKLPNDAEGLAAALKAESERMRAEWRAGTPLPRLFFLIEHAAWWVRSDQTARANATERIRELEALVVRLGGGFDRRGLDGDPRDKPVPQEFKRGSWVDRGCDA